MRRIIGGRSLYRGRKREGGREARTWHESGAKKQHLMRMTWYEMK